MFAADEDDDDFSNVKSSKLASLFGIDQSSAQDGNQSLVYKPQKQPKKKTNSGTSNQKGDAPSGGQPQHPMAVIFASVVHAYTFEDGKHVHQGKLGAAIVGNSDSRTYRIILYKGKQQTVATANITATFPYTVQTNNYATFYDTNRKNWSINFENETSSIECAKQVGLAKANSCSLLQETICQDLSIGQGEAIRKGTTINLKYTGWTLEKMSFGQVIDETGTYVKVKLGEGAVVNGLDEGLNGIASGGKRLLVVPPDSESKSSNTKIPKESIIVYIVEVGDLVMDDIAKDKKTSSTSSKRPSGPSTSSSDETTVRARGASISEQLHQSPKTDKAKIISRMAKMGQQMLPLQGAIPAQIQSSESETEEDQRQHGRNTPSPHSSSPEPQPKPRPRGQNHLKLVHGNVAPHIQQPIHAQQPVIPQLPLTYSLPVQQQQQILPMSAGNPYMIMPSASYVGSPASSVDSHIPFLLSEVRSQNTEIRLQMGQVSEKMDRVIGKLDQSPMSYPVMEASMLGHHIQRIIEENEKLKSEAVEKNHKIETQMGTITELLHRNQRFLEQSNSMLEQRSSSSFHAQTRLMSMEEENARFMSELDVLKRKLSEVVSQLDVSQKRETSLEEELAVTLKSESDVRKQIDELQHLQNTVKELKQELILKDEALKEREQKFMTLETEIEDRERNREAAESSELTEWKAKFEELQVKWVAAKSRSQEIESPKHHDASENVSLAGSIKKIMNAVYRNLQTKFESEEKYTGEDVNDILASTIRAVTLELMEHFEKKSAEKNKMEEGMDVKENKTEEVKEVQTSVTKENKESDPKEEKESVQKEKEESVWKEESVRKEKEECVRKEEEESVWKEKEESVRKEDRGSIPIENEDSVAKDDEVVPKEEKKSVPKDDEVVPNEEKKSVPKEEGDPIQKKKEETKKNVAVDDECDDDQYWKPQPPPFTDSYEDNEEDWFS